MKPKRLFFDIETSPNIALLWEPGHQISISSDFIIKERAIICVGWQWGHEKKVHALTWDKNHNDKTLLEKFVKIMHEADEIITHNGDGFDTPWIRTRCLKHGIPLSPDFVSIDTLKAARSKFKFNSNRLNYIAKFLNVGEKIHTDLDLWKAVVLDKNSNALKEMVRYCKKDVSLLKEVWEKMDSYLPAKSNFGSNIKTCPSCSSVNVKIAHRRVTAQMYKKVQFQCKDCGKYHTVAESRFNKVK